MIGRDAIGSKVLALSAILMLLCARAWSAPAGDPSTGEPTSVNATQAPAQKAPELTTSDVGAFLDGIVSPQLAREDIAGAVVVVVKDGQVLYARGYGYSDMAKRIPVSSDSTLFRIASISKLFTFTAVMQLVEEGKLDLDRDVNGYLDFRIPATYSRPITLRNLMTHTAGFEETAQQLWVGSADELVPLEGYVKQNAG
jgi:CubicO group peptidase (beta-lactamase class C family)